VTGKYVRGEVEFWNEERDLPSFVVKLEALWHFCHPFPYVLGPLASNVIRYDKVSDLGALEGTEEQIVNIDITKYAEL
jgi:hypothetical protein